MEDHKRIKLDEMTLSIAKMDPDFWAALSSGLIIEAARDAAERHGLSRPQYEMLKAYLEADD